MHLLCDPLSAARPEPLTVIGVGSPWGDDRVGWRVAEGLAAALPEHANRVLIRDRPGSALLDDLTGRTAVVLIDAVCAGTAAGTIHCLCPGALVATAASGGSTHGFGVAQTLELGRVLGLLPQRLHLFLISIDPAQTAVPEAALTPAVAAAAERLTAHLAGMLAGPARLL